MSDTPHDHTSREARVDNVIASHLQAMERGEARDWRTYLARHPDIARELSLFFADQAEFQRAAGKWLSGTAEFRDTPQNVENTPPPKVAPSTWNAQEGPAGDAPAGADRFGDYELLEEIARGGMGVVYKARQVNLDRLVAVKMILGGQLASAAEVRRFQTEAEAAANLDHPNIVPIFEVGQHDGRHYFSMGFVEGQSLAARVAAGPLPPREAAELVRKVSAAVEYAHQRGVIHRDLKPANILLDQQGQPRVTDFGLAKRVDRDSNMTGNHILGTPSYMPPEQASGLGERIGAASDVYSLGAVLYCLLTGRPPFQAANPLDTLRHVLDRAPLPARLLNPGIPLDLDTIALKCLEKTPERRYATARELTDELDRFLAGAPIRARPVGQVERGWRWCRRNRTVAALSAAVMVSLFAGLGGSVWQAVRAVHERDLKQQALEVAKANEKKAVTEKQVAQAVRGFLQHDLLRQADATEQADSLRHLGGRFKATENPTIKELLDRAAAELTPEKIDSNFPDQPEVQASILLTVGNTYRGIGHYQQAVEFLLRASQIFRETLGADHADALASLDGLGLAYLLDGKLPEAIELFEQILAARAKNPSDDQKETLATLNKLAYAHSLAGHLPEAIDLFEQARDAKRKEVGVEDRQMLVILNNLALAYQAAGRCREAIQLFEQVRNDEIKTLGAQDPDTLTTLDNLAGAYLEVGRLPDAIALFEQVRTGRVAVRGPNHPETLITLNNLALAYQSAGRLAEAIELFEQVRKDTIDAFGPNHVETLVTLNNLAEVYQDSGKLPEAIELLQQIRDALAQTPGASRLRSLTTLHSLALAYQAAGKLPEAIALFEQVVKERLQTLGFEHMDTIIAKRSLAGAYQDVGRLPEAIEQLEQARDAAVSGLGPDHVQTLRTLNKLALAYRDAGRLAAAIDLFEQVRTVLIDTLGPNLVETLATSHNLAQAYQDAGKLPQAIELLQQVRDALAQIPGANPLLNLTTLHSLALAYLAADRLPEAIELFEKVVDERVQTLGLEHVDTIIAKCNLGVAYQSVGRLPEAIEQLQQAGDAAINGLGRDHVQTLRTLNNLAVAYRDGADWDRALPLFRQIAEAIEKRGFQHAHAALIIANLVGCHEHLQQYDEAESWRRKWVAAVRDQAGPEHPAYAGELAALGSNQLVQKKWGDAEHTLRECLTLREKLVARADPMVLPWQVANIRSMLGEALAGRQKYADAEPLLLAGYDGLKEHEATIPPQGKFRLTDALRRLVSLYDALGKQEEAAVWRTQLEARTQSEESR